MIDERWITTQKNDWWNCLEISTNSDYRFITLSCMLRTPTDNNKRWFVIYDNYKNDKYECRVIYKQSLKRD